MLGFDLDEIVAALAVLVVLESFDPIRGAGVEVLEDFLKPRRFDLIEADVGLDKIVAAIDPVVPSRV